MGICCKTAGDVVERLNLIDFTRKIPCSIRYLKDTVIVLFQNILIPQQCSHVELTVGFVRLLSNFLQIFSAVQNRGRFDKTRRESHSIAMIGSPKTFQEGRGVVLVTSSSPLGSYADTCNACEPGVLSPLFPFVLFFFLPPSLMVVRCLLSQVFVLMQFDPGLEYKPTSRNGGRAKDDNS